MAPWGMYSKVMADLMVLELGPPVRASRKGWLVLGVSGLALLSALMMAGPIVLQARGTRLRVASGAGAGRAPERERREMVRRRLVVDSKRILFERLKCPLT